MASMIKWLQKHWKRTPGHVRKPFIFLLGFTIVGAGIVMLAIPGPGWAAIFLGFAILASEFEFAERVRDKLVHALKEIIAVAKKIWKRFVQAFKKWLET